MRQPPTLRSPGRAASSTADRFSDLGRAHVALDRPHGCKRTLVQPRGAVEPPHQRHLRGVAARSRHAEPHVCCYEVARNAFPQGAHHAEVELCTSIPPVCGFPVPCRRCLGIFGYTLAVVIQPPEATDWTEIQPAVRAPASAVAPGRPDPIASSPWTAGGMKTCRYKRRRRSSRPARARAMRGPVSATMGVTTRRRPRPPVPRADSRPPESRLHPAER